MTDIDKVLAAHRESTMPAWKGACAADGDDFPCLEYRLASELDAARKVVQMARMEHGRPCDCDLCISVTAYDRVMEEQR